MLPRRKKQGLTKLGFLHEVAKIEGVYVPSFTRIPIMKTERLPPSRQNPARQSASKAHCAGYEYGIFSDEDHRSVDPDRP